MPYPLSPLLSIGKPGPCKIPCERNKGGLEWEQVRLRTESAVKAETELNEMKGSVCLERSEISLCDVKKPILQKR